MIDSRATQQWITAACPEQEQGTKWEAGTPEMVAKYPGGRKDKTWWYIRKEEDLVVFFLATEGVRTSQASPLYKKL